MAIIGTNKCCEKMWHDVFNCPTHYSLKKSCFPWHSSNHWNLRHLYWDNLWSWL